MFFKNIIAHKTQFFSHFLNSFRYSLFPLTSPLFYFTVFLLFINIIVINMHITVIDNKLITSAIDIVPVAKPKNLSIKSILENISLISIKNHGATKIPIVSIADII